MAKTFDFNSFLIVIIMFGLNNEFPDKPKQVLMGALLLIIVKGVAVHLWQKRMEDRETL